MGGEASREVGSETAANSPISRREVIMFPCLPSMERPISVYYNLPLFSERSDAHFKSCRKNTRSSSMRFIAVLIHSIFIIILQNNSWIDVDLSRRRIVHTHVV